MTLERRFAPRHAPDASEPASRLRLRGGRELLVVEISASGALVETAVRLLPGTHVDVHIVTTDGRILMRSRVVRAFVFALSSDRVAYRGALAFGRPIVPAGYALPPSSRASEPEGTPYPAAAA